MQLKPQICSMSVILLCVLLFTGCATLQPTPTSTPKPTKTSVPTDTPTPSPTLKPTRTPNLAKTQQIEEWNAEAQTYFEAGYLSTANGVITKFGDFKKEWAKLGWYRQWHLDQYRVGNHFYMSAHFKWASAYRSADLSGCGFTFAGQRNGDHYAVFLDRSKVLFAQTEEHYSFMGPTRGTGRVKFGNPYDQPVEADFTLIVKEAYAYVLVDGELVGEYTLSSQKVVPGIIGLTLLSGTNKDFGTRCEMTNVHLWAPKKQ
jgi:hypothetical protein